MWRQTICFLSRKLSSQQHKAHTCFANKNFGLLLPPFIHFCVTSYTLWFALIADRLCALGKCVTLWLQSQMPRMTLHCCCPAEMGDITWARLLTPSSFLFWEVIHSSRCPLLSYMIVVVVVGDCLRTETYLHSVHLSEHSQLSSRPTVVHAGCASHSLTSTPQHFFSRQLSRLLLTDCHIVCRQIYNSCCLCFFLSRDDRVEFYLKEGANKEQTMDVVERSLLLSIVC